MEEEQESLFNAIYRQHSTELYTYLSHMVHDQDELADVFQETCIRLFRSMSILPHEERPLRTYLYRIATNIVIDIARKKQRQQKLIQCLQYQHERLVSDFQAAEDQVVCKNLILATLHSLPPHFAACLYLYEVAGFKQRDIAHILGFAEKSISVYLSRAREHFRQAYLRIQTEQDRSGKEVAQ